MLHTIAWVWIGLSLVTALLVALDVAVLKRQPMGVMNFVWPLTMLYAGPLGLIPYLILGRPMAGMKHDMKSMHDDKPPTFGNYVTAATHCGSGCTLGDLVAESIVALVPGVLTVFGYAWLFPKPIFAGWVLDFVLALGFGLLFQYFSIKPMKQLSPGRALVAALKADTLSLTSWQVGMYGWMAIATFAIFGHELPKGSPVFWFMMQIAMVAGFFTALPVNVWLVNSGIKEKM